MIDSVSLGSSSGKSLSKVSFKTQATRFSIGDIDNSIDRTILNSVVRPTNELYSMEEVNLKSVQSSEAPVLKEGVMDFAEQSVDVLTTLPEPVEAEGITVIDVAPDSSNLTPDPQFTDSSPSSEVKTSIEDIVSGFGDSLNASVEKGQSTFTSSLDSVKSSINSVIKSATDIIENAKSRLSSTVDRIGESADDKLTDMSSDFRGAVSKAGVVGVDVLRSAIVAFEDSFAKGASFVVSSYSSVKEFLPSDIKGTLNLSEAKTAEILKPVGAVTRQVIILLLLRIDVH